MTSLARKPTLIFSVCVLLAALSSGHAATSSLLPAPSGNLPLAPSITAVYPQVQGATLYVSTQAPARGNTVQYFTATSNPGGITAKSNGNSNRIDITGLTDGTKYTFTVTATNASGKGPASAPSASISGAPYSDYWVANGAGLNTNWSYYQGSAGSAVDWNATVSGVKPPSGTTVVKFQANGSHLFTLPYVKHSLIDSKGNPSGVGQGGGKFFLGPYGYVAISVWPTHTGQKMGLRFYQSNALNGILTQNYGTSVTLLTDSAQNWTPNALSSKGFSFLDLTTAKGNNIVSNSHWGIYAFDQPGSNVLSTSTAFRNNLTYNNVIQQQKIKFQWVLFAGVGL